MTMRHFADLVGRSVSWAEKIESGEREIVRLPMLERVAEVLQISVSALINDGDAVEAQHRPDAAEISAIKSALGSYGSIVEDGSGTPLDVDSLRQQVEYVNAAFLASDFVAVSKTLPPLIAEAARITRSADRSSHETTALAVTIYKIASSTLHKFGSHDVAWLAVDRAMYTALDVPCRFRTAYLRLVHAASCRSRYSL
ncbi:helix-turn-helix transcriptional regulator, partial [Actinocorallia libanotica]|uniref:helix-turn-helix domain-containing protein n=1 Tax=Actinocorallia libanotica TaxID=46162 RepID=UPI0031D2AB65